MAAKNKPAPRAGRKTASKPRKYAKNQKVARATKAELKIDRFLREYVVDLNGRQAAIRAGYSPDSARQTASELLARADVQAKLQVLQERVAVSLGISKELVLERLRAIGTADPRELTELHRGACRYCWGKGHQYQRTPRELAAARVEHEAAQDDRKDGTPYRDFDEAGGIGFNPKRDPNPACPECFGDGEGRVVFKDTRDLSPAARLLFAGVEQTQHGLKVRVHSQTDALVHIGKHLGMFSSKVELTGKDGGPVEHSLRDVLDSIEGADTGIGPASSRRE